MLTPNEWALRYASYGWLVIPVEGKRPVGDEWQKRATSDQAAVARIFAQCQHDGVGVHLGQRSDLIDFDCDSPEAEETFKRLFDGHASSTPTFQSTRGKHRLFRWNESLPNLSIKLVIDGLEIRTGNGGKGAQTVFPPSGERHWINDPDSCEVAEIPLLVLDRINARYAELHKPKQIVPQPYAIGDSGEGQLDVPKWLEKHGRQIIGRTEGDVTRWHIECPGIDLHTTPNSYRDCCVTQDASGRLGGCCLHASCGMRDWSSLKAAIGELEWSDFHEPLSTDGVDVTSIINPPKVIVPVAPRIEPIDPDAMSEVFYQVPGLIGEMIAYHRLHAPRPRPELSLAATIALIGAATGRKIMTRSGMRTNIYCVGLAPSGSGKERPRNNNCMACIEAGIGNILGSENPASDAALISELADNPAMLIQIDEVSRYFATIRNAGNNSSHLKNIFTRFLELTGQAENPNWSPKGYADKTKSKSIAYPHLCIYGTSTGDGFWGSVASSDAVDGFLARMMVIEASKNYPRLQETDVAPTPPGVIQVLKDWTAFIPGPGNLGDQFPRAFVVPVDSAAVDRIKTHSDGIEDRMPDEQDDQKAIWSRCSALAKRLSLIFAASRGPEGIQVALEDAVAAVRLANWCTRLLIRRVFTHISANDDDSAKKKVLEIIRKAGSITASELTRKTQWLKDRRTRSMILDDLIEAEWITKEISATGGKFKNTFAIA